jgi:multiple sugar transport system ATP-binding protein
MVFQSPALYPHLTAYENMAFGLKLRRVPKAEVQRRVQEAAELLGLTDCLQRPPMALSGGQRQRVALGRALVRRPAVFLLDEPLANLDPPLHAQLRTEISRLHRNLGSTWIYVTHDQREAMSLGDRVAVVRQGTIQQVAEPLHLWRMPSNMFVADFIGSPAINFLEGTLNLNEEGLVFRTRSAEGHDPLRVKVDETMTLRLKNYADEAVVLALRPEHIAVQTNPPEHLTDPSVQATVETFEALGAETILHLECNGGLFTARVPTGPCANRGTKVWMVFDMRHAHFFDPLTERRIG